VTGSLEDLVNSFDEKLSQCFRDYQEQAEKIAPVQVSVHGKLSVRVSTPDPEVDLHVNGAVRFNNRLQKYDSTYPTNGSYNEGDIIWNIQPRMNSYVGWVCIQTGAPGLWSPFGKIGNS